jgi:hypothetical protein
VRNLCSDDFASGEAVKNHKNEKPHGYRGALVKSRKTDSAGGRPPGIGS